MAQSCLTLCDLMDCRTPGFPVYHHLLEFTQTHVHWVSDAIQPSHPLSSPFLYSGSKFQVQFFAYDVQLYQHHLWKIFCIIKSSCRLCCGQSHLTTDMWVPFCACNVEDKFCPWVVRSPGVGNGNLLQYSCLKNPMDRGARQATVHGVPKSLSQLSD